MERKETVKNPDCKCKKDCTRHGNCAACEAHHEVLRRPTNCGKQKEKKA